MHVQLKFLLQSTNNDVELFLEDLSLSCTISILKTYNLHECESRRLILERYGSSCELAQEAVAYYKSSKFNLHAELRVCIEDQPAVDVGGVRKQFLSDVFAFFTTSTHMRLFEGPENCLRPVFRQTSISSGMLGRWWDIVL